MEPTTLHNATTTTSTSSYIPLHHYRMNDNTTVSVMSIQQQQQQKEKQQQTNRRPDPPGSLEYLVQQQQQQQQQEHQQILTTNHIITTSSSTSSTRIALTSEKYSNGSKIYSYNSRKDGEDITKTESVTSSFSSSSSSSSPLPIEPSLLKKEELCKNQLTSPNYNVIDNRKNIISNKNVNTATTTHNNDATTSMEIVQNNNCEDSISYTGTSIDTTVSSLTSPSVFSDLKKRSIKTYGLVAISGGSRYTMCTSNNPTSVKMENIIQEYRPIQEGTIISIKGTNRCNKSLNRQRIVRQQQQQQQQISSTTGTVTTAATTTIASPSTSVTNSFLSNTSNTLINIFSKSY